MDIVVEREQCVGSGQCIMRMPDVFTSDEEDGLVELVDAHGAGHDERAVRDIAHSCPVQAISVSF